MASSAENIDDRAIYREFLVQFAESVDPTDQLPVRMPTFVLSSDEVTGSIIDWIVQYLNDK